MVAFWRRAKSSRLRHQRCVRSGDGAARSSKYDGEDERERRNTRGPFTKEIETEGSGFEAVSGACLLSSYFSIFLPLPLLSILTGAVL